LLSCVIPSDRAEGVICRLQVAGCRSEFGKRVKCPEWFTDLPEVLKQNITMMFWRYHILDRVM